MFFNICQNVLITYNNILLALAVRLLSGVQTSTCNHYALWDDAQNEMERLAGGKSSKLRNLALSLKILARRANERAEDMDIERAHGCDLAEHIIRDEDFDTRGLASHF